MGRVGDFLHLCLTTCVVLYIGICSYIYSVPGYFEQLGLKSSFTQGIFCFLFKSYAQDCPKYTSQNAIECKLQASPFAVFILFQLSTRGLYNEG